MNARNLTVLLATLAAGLTAAACIPDIEEPDVRIAGARLGGLGLEGGVVYVQLSVVNPNDFALETDALTYDLDLSDPEAGDDDWLDFADGTYSEDVRVAGNDSAVVEIPVEFTYGGIGGAVRSILATGTVGYRLRGIVQVAEPLRVEIPYSRRGTMSFGESNEY